MRPQGERKRYTSVSSYESANTTDVTTSEIDMKGYDSVLFIALYGTAASDNTPHLEQDTVTGMGSAADLAGTEVGVGSSDELVWVEVINPEERFIRAVFERGTSSDLGPILAIRSGGRDFPEDNTVAGTIHGETHNRPAEGTK